MGTLGYEKEEEMKRSLSQVLHEVDPDLKIVRGHHHRSKNRTTDSDWEKAAGPVCPRCGRERFRFIEGICFQCAEAKDGEDIDKLGIKAMKRYYTRKLREGTITLTQMRKGLL